MKSVTVLKMERMQANDKSMPSCVHSKTLKEIRSYDQARNGLSIAYVL